MYAIGLIEPANGVELRGHSGIPTVGAVEHYTVDLIHAAIEDARATGQRLSDGYALEIVRHGTGCDGLCETEMGLPEGCRLVESRPLKD